MSIDGIRVKMRFHGVLAVGLAVLIWAPAAHAGDGYWTSATAAATWSNTSNWANGNVAEGAGATAWFTNDLTVAINVSNNNSRIIGNVIIGDRVGTSYIFSFKPRDGATLTFDNGVANSQLTQTNPSAANVFGLPLVLNSSLDIANTDDSDFTVTNNITGSGDLTLKAQGAGLITLATGLINPSGTIVNSGPSNASISAVIGSSVKAVIQNSASSTLTLSGGNTFTNLTINTGTVIGLTSAYAFGTNTGTITLGDAAGGSAAASLLGGVAGPFSNAILVAGVNTGVMTITNSIATSFNGPVTLNTHPLTLASGATALILGGGITGTGDLTINAAGAISLSNKPVNASGTITNSGTGAGVVTIKGGVGANVTAITENSTSSALTLSLSNLTVNSSGTTLANVSGGAVLTLSGGVRGTGDLILKNNSVLADGITVSTLAVTNAGQVINSGTGSGNVLISAVIDTNVTAVIQNSTNSQLTLSGVNTFTNGLIIKAGTVKGTGGRAFGAITSVITLGDTNGSADTTLIGGWPSGNTCTNPIAVASNNTGIATIVNSGNGARWSGLITLYDHDLTVSAPAPTFNFYVMGGVAGRGNLTIKADGTSGMLIGPLPVNNAGVITNSGVGSLAVDVSGGVGSNVTAVIENSTNSALTINTLPLTVNSSGTTLANINASGVAKLTVSGGVNGTGDLILKNNSAIVNGITVSGTVTNMGRVVNSGIGPSNTLISAIIGSNVTSVVQDSGTSILLLSNVNTYVGNTLISNGTLRVGIANAIPDGAGKSNVLVNGTLDVNFAETINGLTGTGTVDNSSATPRILTVGGNDQTSTFSGIITNTGAIDSLALTKSGTGTLTLTGTNGYGGATAISAGALNIRNGGALGITNGATTVTAGAALQLQGGITTLAEALTLNGTGVANDGALRNMSGDNTYAGAITLATASRINSDGGTLTLNGAIGGAVGLTFGGSGNVTVTNAIGTTGAATLMKDGTGTLTLLGASTYTNVTIVSNGTLLVNGSLGVGGTVRVTTNGILGGTGGISRAVTIAAGTGGCIGGTLAPGGTDVGTLMINSNFTLVPTNIAALQPVWSVQLNATTNDLLVVNGSFIMTNIGRVTLNVANGGGSLPNNQTYTLLTWTNANPAGNGTQFDVVSLDPTWSGGTVTVDTNAKKVVLSGLLDRIANVIATNVLNTTADLIGNLTSTGSSPTTVWAFWDTTDHTTNKTWPNSTNFVASRLGWITNSIAGLTPNQTNYFTYYASNTEGEVWAQPSLSFKTYGTLSVDNDGGATNIGFTSATLRGTLLNGNDAYASVRWGTGPASLTSTSTPVWVTEGVFSIPVGDLVPNTTYYYQSFVSNAYGTALAASITNFTTHDRGALYVAINGPAGGDGSSWAMAFTNLQTAIDTAAAGESIYLAGHTFSNSATQLNSKYVWTNKPLTILGGYAADGGTPGALGTTPTILTSSNVAVGASTRILYISGLTNGTLQRVTVTGGTGFSGGGSGAMHGSGLYIASSSNLTISACVISNNFGTGGQPATTYGGGIYLIASDVRLTGCYVVSNKVNSWEGITYGGGIHLASGNVAISNSVICGNALNTSSTDGSGSQYNWGYGGGVSLAGGTLTMWNTLVAGNRGRPQNASPAATTDDGIYVNGGAASLVNCTVVYNNKVGIRYVAGTVALTNTIVWGHTINDTTNFPTAGGVLQNVSYSMFGAPAAMDGVNGCLTNNPIFVNTNSGDYRLQTMSKRWSVATGTWVNDTQVSPGIDVGINQDWMASATDLDGLPRITSAGVDMGAYEAQFKLANIMATNVTTSTADLIGYLGSTDASPTTVWAFWDTNNCTTNKTWANSTNFVASSLGFITNSITELPSNQTNYFTYYASNTEGEVWAQPSVLFKTYGALSVDNGVGATSIGYTIATLNGTLLSGNAAYASIRWGVNADLTLSTTSTPESVMEGPFSVLVTGLVNNTTYYYQSLVSNAFDTAAAAITNFATPLYTGLYVATNGPAGGDGSSWGMAFTNIASAFAVTPTGETIYVAGHTFALTSQLVWPTNNLTLLGGYAATNTSVGPGNYDSLKWPTIIMRNPASNTRLLSMLNKTNALIERVTFRGGNGGAKIGIVYTGCGLYATNSYGLIRDTVFENNIPSAIDYARGGGAYLASGGLTFEHVVFANNTVICPNTYFAYGAGVYIDSGTHRFRNILGVGGRNHPSLLYAVLGGSFLYVNAGTVTVENATLAHNSGTGAALHRAGGSLQVANSILWDNDCVDYAGTITFSNSCAAGLTAGVNGNLNQDPLFQTPLFYLAANSPCIAQGNRTVEAAGVTNRTSFTNGVLESAGTAVNLGYHFRDGLVIDRELWVNPDPATGSDANSGTAGSPLRTITKALTLAPRTRINLAAGNYTNGVETFPLMIDNGRTAQLIGTNRDTTVINSSGSAKTALMLVNSLGDNRIEGVTLTTGNSSRGLTISNAVFTLTGCSIASNLLGNLAGPGAGLYAAGAHGWIRDTLFLKNVEGMDVDFVGGHGGGVYLLGGGMLFDQVQVISNRVAPSLYSAYGAGMYIDRGMHRLKNILIVSNNATGSSGVGAGCYISDGTVVIENATVVNNTASGAAAGGAIYRVAGTVSVNNSILWNNSKGDSTGTIAFSNSCSTSLTAGVQGNLTNDPLFVDTTYYHLQSKAGNYVGGYFSGGTWGKSPTNSPCIDAGDTNSSYALEPASNGRRVNLGAYGNTSVASLSSSSAGTVFRLR